MAWGFMDWVRGRPFKGDRAKVVLPRRPTERQVRRIAFRLLEEEVASDVYRLLDGHRELARPVLERLMQ